MKNLLKLLFAGAFAFAPIYYTIHLLFYKLAPYIASLIPAGEWHALLAVAVYVAIAFLGGIELIILSLLLGFSIAGMILSTMESK